jgi:hypothetical protein
VSSERGLIIEKKEASSGKIVSSAAVTFVSFFPYVGVFWGAIIIRLELGQYASY